jgi:hypothetical protein
MRWSRGLINYTFAVEPRGVYQVRVTTGETTGSRGQLEAVLCIVYTAGTVIVVKGWRVSASQTMHALV